MNFARPERPREPKAGAGEMDKAGGAEGGMAGGSAGGPGATDLANDANDDEVAATPAGASTTAPGESY